MIDRRAGEEPYEYPIDPAVPPPVKLRWYYVFVVGVNALVGYTLMMAMR